MATGRRGEEGSGEGAARDCWEEFMRKCRPNLWFTPFVENIGSQKPLGECRFTFPQTVEQPACWWVSEWAAAWKKNNLMICGVKDGDVMSCYCWIRRYKTWSNTSAGIDALSQTTNGCFSRSLAVKNKKKKNKHDRLVFTFCPFPFGTMHQAVCLDFCLRWSVTQNSWYNNIEPIVNPVHYFYFFR